jgi:hypothetical protein
MVNTTVMEGAVNIAMCSMETIVLFVFIYYFFSYINSFKGKVDYFTVSTFSLVLLTVLTRVPEKMVYYPLSIAYQRDNSTASSIWFNAHVRDFQCPNYFSTIMSMCFLTCAVIINSTRWLIVV